MNGLEAAADSSPAVAASLGAPELASAPLPPPVPPSTKFDPGALVPEEYDLFCEGCGYSLVGLQGDRCPECGKPFEPLDLPFARVPWLHRRRVGYWKAYRATVADVVFRPRDFALEMCRPVRISKVDAARFRRLSIRVALGTAAAILLLVLFLGGGAVGSVRLGDWLLGSVLFVVGVVATEVFLRLATDVPLFIWKGLPSPDPTELAPLHHYAAAPLGLAACAFPLAAAAPALAVFVEAPPWGMYGSYAFAGAVLLAWLGFLWVTPLRLMRAATGCDNRQVRKLAFYLPVHWLLMAIVVTLAVVAGAAIVSYVSEGMR